MEANLHKAEAAEARGTYIAPASTANHDLSSGRHQHTLAQCSAVGCMGNCKWEFLHGWRQRRQRAGPGGEMGHSGGPRWGQRHQISAPPPFRSTFLRQKSRAAFQGWRRGAGEAAQFLARDQAAANIHSVSALLPGGGAWCRRRERSGWRQWWADWLAAPWRQLPVCPATLSCWRHPTFLFIFPPAPPGWRC